MLKKFILKSLLFILPCIGMYLFLFIAMLVDDDNYLFAYNKKIQILENTPQPRIIFVGGSNIAFGIDSKTISDSLHINIVNFGLHAGLGIRIPLEDCLLYAKQGDMVVMQFEYENFYSGGNGGKETLPIFMKCTNWEYINKLNLSQWVTLVEGIIADTHQHYISQLFDSGSDKNMDVSAKNMEYKYVASGFDEFGDEVSHLYCRSEICSIQKTKTDKNVDMNFMKWLVNTIHKYEEKGIKVIMLPPVCVQSYYRNAYNDNISVALKEIEYHYVVNPSYMVLDDSCYFNTGYHVNNYGVIQNTNHIINVLREHL